MSNAFPSHVEEQKPASGPAKPPAASHKPIHGLLVVGIFKLMKAIFFGGVAAGALHLVHHNIGDLVMRLTDALPLDPEGRFVGMLLDKADLIDNHHLRQAGMLAFGYSICCLVEGVGLILQQVWAEYVTVVLTVAALPYELVEIARRVTAFRLSLLGLNLAVLVYLVWLLRSKLFKKEFLTGIN